jgi:hypothetical protein
MEKTPVHQERATRDSLTAALEVWRSASPAAEHLSAECRDRVLRESVRPAVAPPLARLFLPARQWVAGAAIPVVLAAALGTALWNGDGAVSPRGASIASIAVHRHNGEVVFTIDNGGRPHRVLRSTDPRGEDVEQLAGGGRVFRDRLDSGPDIVFYRIE